MLPNTEAIRKAKAIWSTIGLTILILSGAFLTMYTLYKMSAAVEDVLYSSEYNITTGCRYDYTPITGRWCRSQDGKDSELKLICSGDNIVVHFFCICTYFLYAVFGLAVVILWTMFVQAAIVNPLRDIYYHYYNTEREE